MGNRFVIILLLKTASRPGNALVSTVAVGWDPGGSPAPHGGPRRPLHQDGLSPPGFLGMFRVTGGRQRSLHGVPRPGMRGGGRAEGSGWCGQRGVARAHATAVPGLTVSPALPLPLGLPGLRDTARPQGARPSPPVCSVPPPGASSPPGISGASRSVSRVLAPSRPGPALLGRRAVQGQQRFSEGSREPPGAEGHPSHSHMAGATSRTPPSHPVPDRRTPKSSSQPRKQLRGSPARRTPGALRPAASRLPRWPCCPRAAGKQERAQGTSRAPEPPGPGQRPPRVWPWAAGPGPVAGSPRNPALTHAWPRAGTSCRLWRERGGEGSALGVHWV